MAENSTNQNFSLRSGDVNNDVITSGPIAEEIRRELMDIYIYPLVFVIMVMTIGFVGNGIVIYIFTSKWKLTKNTVFILTLAGVDIMSCVINMPTEAAILWHPMDFDYDVICKLSRYTTFIASVSSSFVLIAISIDRYLMVCRPFLGRELGVRYAKKTCFVAVMLGILITWPSLIFYGTYTYHVEKVNEFGHTVQVEVKTCLISNFYVDNYKLPAGFYFFLFGGHIIMFVILTLVYLLIGRKLFISTNSDIPDDRKHSLKYFGMSMMSAITGTVPNSPCENKDRVSWSSRGSRAVSLENINRIDLSPETSVPKSQSRLSDDTNVSIILNDIEKCQNSAQYELNKCINNKDGGCDEVGDNISLPKCSKQCCDHNLANCDKSQDSTPNILVIQQSTASDDSASDASFQSKDKQEKDNRRKLLGLKILRRNKDVTSNGRLSSGSTGSTCCLTQNSPLTPMTPMSPDSVRGILYRSQSVESRARLNRIISDELRRVEVKEISLRRNTLIMRMVTIAFVVSFLPYLVIVTMRYSNTDIPTKLGKVEQIFYNVFLRTYFINSMINPFIYGFMNAEFRAKIRELFCRFCTKTTPEQEK